MHRDVNRETKNFLNRGDIYPKILTLAGNVRLGRGDLFTAVFRHLYRLKLNKLQPSEAHPSKSLSIFPRNNFPAFLFIFLSKVAFITNKHYWNFLLGTVLHKRITMQRRG